MGDYYFARNVQHKRNRFARHVLLIARNERSAEINYGTTLSTICNEKRRWVKKRSKWKRQVWRLEMLYRNSIVH